MSRELPPKDLEMVRPMAFKGKLAMGQRKMIDSMRAKGVNFLMPIQTEVLTHAPYSKNDSTKFLACMNAYEISYRKWKKVVLNELNNFIRLIEKKEASFHCPYCDVNNLCSGVFDEKYSYLLKVHSLYSEEPNLSAACAEFL